jgi:hypothetical protein
MPAADTIAQVADQLLVAIGNSDTAAVGRLWSDDIAVWRVGASRDGDKPRALRVIDWFVSAPSERGYEILDRVLSTVGLSSGTTCMPWGRSGGSLPCGCAS